MIAAVGSAFDVVLVSTSFEASKAFEGSKPGSMEFSMHLGASLRGLFAYLLRVIP